MREIQNEWDPLTRWLRSVPRGPMPDDIREMYGITESGYRMSPEYVPRIYRLLEVD